MTTCEMTALLPLQDLQAIPFPGVVTAGKPFELIEGAEQLKVPRFLLSNGKNLALRVRGDSMVDAGIRDGDIVIVRKQRTAENGQTVVALVNGEATVKRSTEPRAQSSCDRRIPCSSRHSWRMGAARSRSAESSSG